MSCFAQRNWSKWLSTLKFHWILWLLLTFPLWIKDDISDVLKVKDHHFSINFVNSQGLLSLVPNIKQFICVAIVAVILQTFSHESSNIILSAFSHTFLLIFPYVTVSHFLITSLQEDSVDTWVTPEDGRSTLLTPCSDDDRWPMSTLRPGSSSHQG